MFRFEHSAIVNAPVATVWQVITDLPRYGEWNPFCLAAESTLQPGAPMRMTVQLMAKPQQVEEVMQTITPLEGFSYAMKPAPLGLLSSLRAHRLEALPDGRCRYVSQFQLRGPLSHVVKALLGKKLHSGFAAMTAAVKNRAEQLAAR